MSEFTEGMQLERRVGAEPGGHLQMEESVVGELDTEKKTRK